MNAVCLFGLCVVKFGLHGLRCFMKNEKNRTLGEANVIRKVYQENALATLAGRLDMLSELMEIYCERIKSMQPVAHGSLTPHLQVCNKDGCFGCLHVRWKKWFDPAKEQRKRNKFHGKKVGEKVVVSSFGSKDVKNISQILPRGEEYQELRELIKAFETVRKQRARLVEYLSSALKSTSYLESE